MPDRINIFKNEICLHGSPLNPSGNPALTNTGAMNAVNDYVSFAFVPNQNLTINRVSFRTNGQSSPVGIVVTGGIALLDSTTGLPTQSSSVITFIQSGTTSTFTTGANTTITLSSNASLTAGTKYCVAFQITSRTSGSITLNNGFSNTFYLLSFPCHHQRVAGVESQIGRSISTLNWGYNDGSSTTWYNFSPEAYAAGSAQSVNRSTAPVYYENGCKICLLMDFDELVISSVTIYALINTNHLSLLQIYDSDGVTALASGIADGNHHATINDEEWTVYYLNKNLTIKPFKYYYIMLSVVLGAATNTNATTWAASTQDDSTFDNNLQMINIGCTRTTSLGTITEVTTERKIFFFNIEDIKYTSSRSSQSGM